MNTPTYGNLQKKSTMKNKLGRAINKQQSLIKQASDNGYNKEFIDELKSQSLLLLEISQHYSDIVNIVNLSGRVYERLN